MLTYSENWDITPQSVDNPDIIRLYQDYCALRDTNGRVRLSDIRMDSLWCLNDLMLLERVSNTDFSYLHYGLNIQRAAGFSMQGKRTSEFNSPVGAFFIEKYVESMAAERPLFTAHRAIHAMSVAVWERLILPLEDDEGVLRYVLAYNRPQSFASELLAGVLDGSPDAIVALSLVDVDGSDPGESRIELVNRVAETTMGGQAADLLFQCPDQWSPDLFGPSVMLCCHRVHSTGVSETMVHECTLDGSPHWYRVAISQLPKGVVATFTDITALTEANQSLETLSNIDPLTQVANRRFFFEQADRECERSRRHERSLSVFAIDIDHFKSVNDTYGHAVGDRVLAEVSVMLSKSVRQNDVIGRLGGEEFAILLPETELGAAIQLAERVRAKIEAMLIDSGDHRHQVTVSIGVAEWLVEERDLHETLLRADAMLYRAKERGRNLVCWAEPAAGPEGNRILARN